MMKNRQRLPKTFYVRAMLLGIFMAAPIALYVRIVGNPGLFAMALACLGAAIIVFALLGWRRNPGFGVVLTGITLNVIAVLSNGGRMPVVNYNGENYGTLWQPATEDTRFVFLVDQDYLGYASWGDVLIGLGLAAVVLVALSQRLRIGLRSAQPSPQA